MIPSLRRYFFVFTFAAFIMVFYSCQKQEKPAKKPEVKKTEQVSAKPVETPTEAVEISNELHAMITFLSGDVYVFDGSDWQEANIGEFLKKGDLMKVGKESYCEIQFGNTASIRVQADTEIKLKDILLQVQDNNVKVGLITGAVLSKVRKLSKNDRFRIQTPSVICGVRGTQFGVRFSKEKGTVVAVKKGRVSVLPAAIDIDAIKKDLKGKHEVLLKTVEKIEKAAPVVDANQEIKIDTAVLNKTEKTFKAVSREIDRIVKAKEEVTPEKVKEVEKLVVLTIRQVEKQISAPRKISKESLKQLDPVEKIKIIEIPVLQETAKAEGSPEQSASKGTITAEQKKTTLSFEKIGIRVEPKDAEIMLNGDSVGRGSFFGLFKQGNKLIFLIKKNGYVPKKLELNVIKGSGRNYQIKLKEMKATIKVNVIPSDAEIIINGKKVAEGSFAGNFLWGEKLSIDARKDGYVEKRINISVEKSSGKTYRLTLQEKKETIEVKAEPFDAEILVNGTKVGTGFYSGKYKWGENLSITARKKGYIKKDIRVVTAEGSVGIYNLKLEREKEEIGIKTTPIDAEIVMNGIVVGKGSYSAGFATGEKVSFKIQRDEYFSKELTIDIKKGHGKVYSVVLKPKAIPYSFSPTDNNIVGKIISFRDRIIFADNKGVLHAVSKMGRKIWSTHTKNISNENSFPELIGSKIFFSGSEEFLISDAVTGNILYRKALTGANNHMFGRHIVSYGQKALFPTDNAIKILDINTGSTIKKIKIPGGSKMTPSIYKNTILIVNQQGVFYKINPNSGKIITKLQTRAVQPVAVAVTVHGNKAFFPGRRGTIVCINLAKNKIIWQKKPAGVKSIGVFQDLEYGKNGIFMFAKSTIYSFAELNGSSMFPPVKGISSPPLYYDGYLYAGNLGRALVVIDAKTGKIVKSLKVGGIISTRPEAAKGRIIVGTKNGKIVVVNPEGIK